MKKILIFASAGLASFALAYFITLSIGRAEIRSLEVPSEETAIEIISRNGDVPAEDVKKNDVSNPTSGTEEKDVSSPDNMDEISTSDEIDSSVSETEGDTNTADNNSEDALINFDFAIEDIKINGIPFVECTTEKVLESFGLSSDTATGTVVDLGDGFTLSYKSTEITVDGGSSYTESTIYIEAGSSQTVQYGYSKEKGGRLGIFRFDQSEAYVDFSKYITVPMSPAKGNFREGTKFDEVAKTVTNCTESEQDQNGKKIKVSNYTFNSNNGDATYVYYDGDDYSYGVLCFVTDKYILSIGEWNDPEQITYNLNYQ